VSGIVDKITAALDRAETERKFAARVPWMSEPVAGATVDIKSVTGHNVTTGGPVENGGDYFGALDIADADLIVSVVNREARQIQHARDVLARHCSVRTAVQSDGTWGDLTDLYPDACIGCEWLSDCSICGEGNYRPAINHVDDCPELKALAAVWCPEAASDE
jgi:hypothetical protein